MSLRVCASYVCCIFLWFRIVISICCKLMHIPVFVSGPKKNHAKPQSLYLVNQINFVPGISAIRARIIPVEESATWCLVAGWVVPGVAERHTVVRSVGGPCTWLHITSWETWMLGRDDSQVSTGWYRLLGRCTESQRCSHNSAKSVHSGSKLVLLAHVRSCLG
jgi:hypothetical protein